MPPYVSLTTSIFDIPYLGSLPFNVGEVKTFSLDPYVPSGISEVLIYVYMTMETSTGPMQRGFYHIYTEDDVGIKYGQFMNVVFTHDDFVTSSDNLWLPVFNTNEIKVEIPMAYPILQEASYHPEPKFRNLADGMKSYVEQGGTMYADVYLLGFK